jgi:hypothetical protein
MPSDNVRHGQLPDRLTPGQWQASALRCPCGFATDDVQEFDGHLEATADEEPEHFETEGNWTLHQVRQWLISMAPARRPGPVREANADIPAPWSGSEDRPHLVGIVLPIPAGVMVAALYGDRKWLRRADLATDQDVWENAMLVVIMDGLNAVQELADEILIEEHRRTLADPVWLALCRRRVSEAIAMGTRIC